MNETNDASPAPVERSVMPLLPCPFCGDIPEMNTNRENAKIIYFQVECDCGAIAGSAYTTESAAVKNWNRRHNMELRGATDEPKQ